MPLINCKVSLTLSWSKNWVLTYIQHKLLLLHKEIIHQEQQANAPTNATCKIIDTKFYLSVVTLSTENDKKLLEQSRTGFKITIKWNRYRSEMTNQTENNTLNYFIDPKFTKFNILLVLSFENEDNSISFFKELCTRCLNKRLNWWKVFFNIPIKNDKQIYKQIIEMGRNNGYTTGNLLDYEYFSKHYKLFTTDVSKQIQLENPDLEKQISFIGRLESNRGATMIFIIEKWEETTLNLHKMLQQLFDFHYA